MADEQLEWMFNLYDNVSGPAAKMQQSLNLVDGQMGKLNKQMEGFDGKAAAAAKQQQAAAGSSDQFNSAVGRLAEGVEKLNEKLEATRKNTEDLKHLQIGELLVEGLKMAYDWAEKVVEKIVDVGKEALNAAGVGQRMGTSLKMMFGKEGAEDLEAWVDKFSKVSEFTHAENTSLLLKGLTSGLTRSQSEKALPAALDLAALKPARDSEEAFANAQGAMEALSRIQRGGAANVRTLGAFGIQVKDLVSQLGGTATDDRQANQKFLGGQSSEDLTNAIYAIIQKRTGGALGTGGAEQGKGFIASVHKIQGMPEAFFEKAGASGGFKELSGFLDNIVQMMDPSSDFGKQAMKAINDTFDALFGGLSGAEGQKAIMAMLDGVLTFLKSLPEYGRAAHEMFSNLGTVLDHVMLAIEIGAGVAAIAFGLLASPVAIVTAAVALLGVGVYELITHWDGLKESVVGFFTFAKDKIAGWIESFAKFYDKMTDMGANLIQGLVDGITGAFHKAVDAVEGFGSSIIGKLKSVLGIASPSKVFSDMGKNTALGFVQGLESMDGVVSSAVGGIVPTPGAPRLRGGARGGVSVGALSIPLTIQIEGRGKGDQELAELVAKRIEQIVPEALATALEQLAAEKGVDE